MIVILTVILVVAGRDKDRIQIDHIHSKFLKIIQLIHNSLKIAAIKFPDSHNRRDLFPVIHFYGSVPDIEIFPCFHIIGRISVTETIHIDLIHHSTLQPLRHMIARIDLKFCTFLMSGAYTICIIITGNKS